MDVTITDESDDTITFELSDTTPAFANALRRTMIGDIPTLAVEDVRITQNSSGLFDEIVAHRLGLVPWEFEPDKYNTREDCDCDDGCPQCTVSMVLDKEGPATVTAEDLQVTDDEVDPANPETKIVDLADEKAIELEADAILGRGKDHAKWQAANASYSYEEDGDTFTFTVESVSGLAPRTIVHEAVSQLRGQMDSFDESVQEA
jgi:DNA-directed RNA polymerase subunit D